MNLEIRLVYVPVSDVDRAKEFYQRVGFVLDHDHAVGGGIRFVQLTPPGSACSIAVGTGLTEREVAPGSVQGSQAVIADADAARADLLTHGIEASDIHDFP